MLKPLPLFAKCCRHGARGTDAKFALACAAPYFRSGSVEVEVFRYFQTGISVDRTEPALSIRPGGNRALREQGSQIRTVIAS